MNFRRVLALLLLCSALSWLIPIGGQPTFAALVENRYTGLELPLGQAVILQIAQLAAGDFTYQLEMAEENPDLLLRFALLRPQSDSEQPPLELSGGTLTGDFASETLPDLPAGELLFSLAAMPSATVVTAMQDGTIPKLRLNLLVTGQLEQNSDLPPAIRAISPAIGSKVFADVSYLDFQVETEPWLPVYFGTSDQPQAADARGMVSQTMLLGDGLLNSLQAFTVGKSGHISLVTRTVLRHWLTTDPAQPLVLSRRPVWRIPVPDAGIIDLAASSCTIDGNPIALSLDSGKQQLYAASALPLSFGPHQLQLTLYRAAKEPDAESKLLDTLAFSFQLPEHRQAVFQLGQPRMTVNDHAVAIDAAPYLERASNSTMLPLRVLGDLMGAQVDWLSSEQTATFRMGDKVVEVKVGSKTARVNGVDTPLLAPAAIVKGRTMVPLRFVSESLGAAVNWEPSTRQIVVSVTVE